jgi:hypothetical protein
MASTTRSVATAPSPAAPGLSAMLSMLAGAAIVRLTMGVWPVRNFFQGSGTRVADRAQKLGSFR